MSSTTTPYRFGVAIIAALLLLASSADAQRKGKAFAKAKVPDRVGATDSCVAGDCHGALAKPFRNVHEPIAKGECRKCHEQKGETHTFGSVDSLEVCVRCHAPVNTKPNEHMPAAADCYECHAPHGSNERMLLKDRESELCFGCHERELLEGAYQHGPAAAGACSQCHDVHSAFDERNLKLDGVALCAQCHEQVTAKLAGAKQVHKPAAEGCTGCHNPHSGPFPSMLPGTAKGVCAKCHEKILKLADLAKTKHAAVNTEKECANCHDPHASNTEPLLVSDQVTLCLGCHDKPRTKGKHELVSIKELLAKNKDWHGPIRNKNCAGCHQPHGSANFRLLKKDYPPEFYDEFSPKNYALCFSCHDKAMVESPKTSSLTKFRDGTKNLHFVHVNHKKGRTCRACHEVHASKRAKHVREEVPFGTWMLPIDYRAERGGGACSPGCHKPRTYRRGSSAKSLKPKRPAKRSAGQSQ